MSKPLPLTVYDRQNAKLFQEFMDESTSTYESTPRRSLIQWITSSPTVDWLIAAYQDSRLSARKIEPFIRKHNIDMSEFEPGPFKSYAAFFERRFLPGKRTFPANDGEMGAFAEGRYFAWDKLSPGQTFPVKGASLEAASLLGSKARAERFEGGPVILARLSPMDYHHLHYVDDGATEETDRLGHRLWTVNKNALEHQPDILFRNERSIQILQTKNFGRLGMVEVGALTVGRVVRKHPVDKPFKRGHEKAVFRFGGSAVVLFGEPGQWKPEQDLISRTN
ncbi:MAG: phosphatidylserine decarboxylase, partial [Bradyrhizobium sp.]|nr:phosphatidylserine decarboxylase [Bradyrhizobium sp.]